MIYAVLDTNVLVSALLKRGSVPSEVLSEALKGEIIPLLNDDIIEEYGDVLKRSKFRFDSNKVDVLIDELRKRGVFAEQAFVEEKLPDPKDVVFYAVTLEKLQESEAFLVTGNTKHFPAKYFVVTPREMLEIIRERKIKSFR